MTKSTSETAAKVHSRERKRQLRRIKDNRKITKFRSHATIGKIFPRASFNRLLREILQDNSADQPYLLSYRASCALQTAAESYLDNLFDDCDEVLRHSGTETLTCSTIQLVQRLRNKHRASSPDGSASEPGYVMVQQPVPAVAVDVASS